MAETKKTTKPQNESKVKETASKTVDYTKNTVEGLTSENGRKNMGLRTRRFLASLINWVLMITIVINFVLWLIGKEPIGQKLFGTEWFQNGSKGQQFVFGLLSLICLCSMIGWVINIFFWFMEKDSIPVMLTKMIFE